MIFIEKDDLLRNHIICSFMSKYWGLSLFKTLSFEVFFIYFRSLAKIVNRFYRKLFSQKSHIRLGGSYVRLWIYQSVSCHQSLSITPWKQQKTRVSQVFPGGLRKRIVTWNGLRFHFDNALIFLISFVTDLRQN